jgi:serine/threonine protein kinase/Tol biopolymer transport system component
MTPEHWQELKNVLAEALDLQPAERSAYLGRACPEPSVRSEIESLIAAHDKGDSRFLTVHSVELKQGTKLGPYEMLALAGTGGMGQVYRARDTRLNRIVAIKVLPTYAAGRDGLRERFEREAKAISSLNHPHICTLYDVGHQDGIDYLVMEYVEGETLSARLQKGPLPLDQVLKYAIEIADALDKAHRKGITHRDLKPGNIMLTKSGAKLLDFGLAKLTQDASPSGVPLSQLPTKDPITEQGVILGTLQYMAPEQVEGKPVDTRTDIFAFGVVVYEMATSKKAFEGKSQASLMAKILETDPPSMSSLQPMTPLALDRLVKRCLAKDPDDRWQAARDICEQLRWISDTGTQAGLTVPAAPQQSRKKFFVWTLAGIAVLVLATVVTFYFHKSPVEVRAVRFAVAAPEKQTFPVVANTPTFLSVSPDGNKLAFVAVDSTGQRMLWIRDFDSQTAQPLPGTEGAWAPFWSPDSRFVAFTAGTSLKKILVSGGPAQTITGLTANGGGTWNRDGVVLFVAGVGSPVFRVPSAGGSATPVTSLEPSQQQSGHAWPQFLPDGRHFLYLVISENRENSGIYAGSLDSKETKLVLKVNSAPLYSPPGYLLFVRTGTLLAQPFDADRLEIRGDAIPIAEGAQFSTANGAAAVAVSGNGVLAYRLLPVNARFNLVWVDRKGDEQPLPSPPHTYRNPRISPDGRRVAVTIDELGSQEWLLDISRNTLTRLTFEGNYNGATAWTADGKRITFGSDRAGARNLFWQLADGSGGAERLMTSNRGQVGGSWSPDGQTLAFEDTGGPTGFDISIFHLGERTSEPFLKSRFNEIGPHFSPDGRWLAYASDESGRYEVYVQPYPGPGGKWQVSTEGGTEPVWARNGELFYRNGEKMMAVDTTTKSTFSAGNPKLLFEGHYATYQSYPDYDVTADGQRFLFAKASEEARPEISVVLNWTEELKQKVSTGTK